MWGSSGGRNDRYDDSSSRRDRYSDRDGSRSDRYTSSRSGGDRYGGGSRGGSDRYGGGGGGYDRYGNDRGGGNFGSDLNDNIKWDISSLQVFEKNFYYEHPEVTKQSDEEIQRWRQKHDITVNGNNIPKAVHSFQHASFPGRRNLSY